MMRLLLFLVFLGIFSLVFHLGAMMNVDVDTAYSIYAEFQERIEGIDAIGIFSNNVMIALPMFIPGFGAVWGLFSAWSTGYVFAALTVLHPALAEVQPLALLYLTPFGIMEVVAYSIGTSRSCFLLVLILRKRSVLAEGKNTLIEIGMVVGLLLAGGFIEFQMIGMEDGISLPDPPADVGI